MNNTTRYTPLALSLVILLIASAEAQNTWTVREYGGSGGSDCGCYSHDETLQTITLTTNPGHNRHLKFEVYWANSSGEYVTAAPINNFTIAPSVD